MLLIIYSQGTSPQPLSEQPPVVNHCDVWLSQGVGDKGVAEPLCSCERLWQVLIFMSQIYSFLQEKPLSFSGSSSRHSQCPHFWSILTFTSNLNSTLPFPPSGVLRNRWHRAHKALQTPCPPKNSIQTHKTSHAYPFLLSWFLGSMVSILGYLMGQYS